MSLDQYFAVFAKPSNDELERMLVNWDTREPASAQEFGDPDVIAYDLDDDVDAKTLLADVLDLAIIRELPCRVFDFDKLRQLGGVPDGYINTGSRYSQFYCNFTYRPPKADNPALPDYDADEFTFETTTRDMDAYCYDDAIHRFAVLHKEECDPVYDRDIFELLEGRVNIVNCKWHALDDETIDMLMHEFPGFRPPRTRSDEKLCYKAWW